MLETPNFTAAEVLPRYVFLDSLYAGARVLEIGAVAATSGRSARFLKQRGAAFVMAVETDQAAVARAHLPATPGVEFVAGDYMAVNADPFDVIFLHRAADLVYEPGRIAALSRLLTPAGRLVLSLRHPGGLALSDVAGPHPHPDPAPEVLIALLKAKFSSTELLGQTALFGYSIGPSPAREVPTSLDESLAEAAPPAYDLVVAGPAPAGLDSVSLTPLAASLVRELLERSGRPGSAADPLGLAGELEGVFVNDRLRELESRTQAALEEAERVQLQAAQAMAERDQVRTLVTLKAKEASTAQAALQRAEREVEGLKAERSQLEAGSRAAVDKASLAAEALREQLEASRKALADRSSLEEETARLKSEQAEQAELARQLTEQKAEREGLVQWLRTAEAQRAEFEEKAKWADQARESMAAQLREAVRRAADAEGRANAYSDRLAAAERLLSDQRSALAGAVESGRERLARLLEATDAQRAALASELEASQAQAQKLEDSLTTELPEIPRIFHAPPTLSMPTVEPAGPDLTDLTARLLEAERERDGLVKWLRTAEAHAAELEQRARVAEEAREALVEKLRAAQRGRAEP